MVGFVCPVTRIEGWFFRAQDHPHGHLIARSLLQQFAPNMAKLKGFAQVDVDAYSGYARQLDTALKSRDTEAVRSIFEAFSKLNRESVMRAFASYQANISANGNGSTTLEVSSS